MNRLRVLLLVAAVLSFARQALASPATAPATSPATPPSLARGERLDGRESELGPVSLKVVPRTLLFVPRGIFTVIMMPTAWAAEKVERHHVYDRLYWALTSYDRRVGLRPEFVFESSDYIMGGLRTSGCGRGPAMRVPCSAT